LNGRFNRALDEVCKRTFLTSVASQTVTDASAEFRKVRCASVEGCIQIGKTFWTFTFS
jgi:hypothetical protein